ncbi:hypothetical protein P7K49_020371 [Saguinus oedipus]|uniref:Uncharacterized protein n=1 Tax=Saguinus oedipus TaxID=9490 RepID=A0ABQ9V027_SAGOE|nr:hypothetical protein P7K49_020371 [Saguinus oedipus]
MAGFMTALSQELLVIVVLSLLRQLELITAELCFWEEREILPLLLHQALAFAMVGDAWRRGAAAGGDGQKSICSLPPQSTMCFSVSFFSFPHFSVSSDQIEQLHRRFKQLSGDQPTIRSEEGLFSHPLPYPDFLRWNVLGVSDSHGGPVRFQDPANCQEHKGESVVVQPQVGARAIIRTPNSPSSGLVPASDAAAMELTVEDVGRQTPFVLRQFPSKWNPQPCNKLPWTYCYASESFKRPSEQPLLNSPQWLPSAIKVIFMLFMWGSQRCVDAGKRSQRRTQGREKDSVLHVEGHQHAALCSDSSDSGASAKLPNSSCPEETAGVRQLDLHICLGESVKADVRRRAATGRVWCEKMFCLTHWESEPPLRALSVL